jgi:hypothetical protein
MKERKMHYSTQQDLVRTHHDDLLREATRARLAATAHETEHDEVRPSRFHGLREVFQRRRAPQTRPAPAA